ncbi:unnamed protein product [Allacma fusca]|uniref:UBL3-like ubiquitin domain-containing protein n=1 Tax=Allacma fusca TaxID=39272 RepID=A0A8J2JZ26_9HEXA|nr:unnamed protein product [Allacma fusca]
MGSNRNIPTDKINLRLILVSGKTKEFLFSPNDSAGDIAQHVFDSWPEGPILGCCRASLYGSVTSFPYLPGGVF